MLKVPSSPDSPSPASLILYRYTRLFAVRPPFSSGSSVAPNVASMRGSVGDERHQQVGGIQRLAAIVLHERLSLLVPAVLNDVLVNPVADFEPAISWGRERALVREANCPIERDPTHELRIHEFPLTAAYLPHAFILAVPVVADPIGQCSQRGPQVVRDRRTVLVVEISGVEKFAVDVELQLVICAVADAYRF